MRSYLATKWKQTPKAPQTQSTSHQLQDPQYESSHSIVGEVNQITTEQVNCRQQEPQHDSRLTQSKGHTLLQFEILTEAVIQ